MSNLLFTILAAIILMVLVVLALSIGWILTGKVRLRRGCGLRPVDGTKKDTSTCPMCGTKKVCTKEEMRDNTKEEK